MRKLPFIPFFLLCAFAAHSQSGISIRSGLNIATTQNITASPKSRAAFYGGLSAQFPLQNKLFLQPELIYSSKGDKYHNSFGDIHRTLRLNYLNMPLLLGYQFDKKTSILVGPELGYLLSAKWAFNGGDEVVEVTKRYPARFDIAASIGLQYEAFERLSIEARYNYGFNMLYFEDAFGNRYNKDNGANRVFQVGLKFRIRD